MAKRTGGFIGQDGINAPDPATGVTGTSGDEQVEVSFTAPSDVGGAAITGYRVQSNDGIGASGSASPITVTGLTNGTSYTFNVWAINPFGWSSPSGASGSVSPQAVLGLFAGGQTSSGTENTIQQITVATTGNASDFGDLTETMRYVYSMASNTRAVFANGQNSNTMNYVTFSSAGDATDFGDMSTGMYAGGGCANSTRGFMSGGVGANIIQTITIASTGNSTTFGNMIGSDAFGTASCSSSTRGVNFGRWGSGPAVNLIGYFTLGSTGSEADFGDLTVGTVYGAGCGSSTRGLSMGGYSFDGAGGPLNVISYVTIASTGNATDFGDLTQSKRLNEAALSSNTRGVRGGGDSSTNTMDYVTIASTGNATDFGDLLAANEGPSGCSSGHGGLS
jgi:hypothetical protein